MSTGDVLYKFSTPSLIYENENMFSLSKATRSIYYNGHVGFISIHKCSKLSNVFLSDFGEF